MGFTIDFKALLTANNTNVHQVALALNVEETRIHRMVAGDNKAYNRELLALVLKHLGVEVKFPFSL